MKWCFDCSLSNAYLNYTENMCDLVVAYSVICSHRIYCRHYHEKCNILNIRVSSLEFSSTSEKILPTILAILYKPLQTKETVMRSR
jgi:hypothetical protein